MSEAKNLKSEKNRIDFALEFLRAKHPLKTAQCVAAETGISFKTVHSWLCGNTKPGWHHTLALIGAYGPEFLAAVCPQSRIWIEPARRLEELRQLELQRVQLNERIKALGGNQNAVAGMDTSSATTGSGGGILARGPSAGLGTGQAGMADLGCVGTDRLGRLADDTSDNEGGS